MNEHQKIVFVNKINMNRDQSALQMISHVIGIPSKILSYGWGRIEVRRQVHWRDWVKMEFAPRSICQHLSQWCSCDWASSGNPFFPALFPYGSYFSYEQQASLPFTLNCPRQPPVEMHWANKGVRVARCPQQCHRCPCHLLKKSHSSGNGTAPDIYTANLTPHSAIYCYIFLTHILTAIGSSQGSGVPLPSHPQVSVFLGRNASSYNADHSSRCWTPEWLRLGHRSQSSPPMNKPQNKYSKPHSNLPFVSKLLNRNISYHKSKFKLQQTI